MPKKKEAALDSVKSAVKAKTRRRTTKASQVAPLDPSTTKFSDFASQKTSKGAIFGSIHDAFFHYFMYLATNASIFA